MEFINYIRLDVICVIAFVATILLSIFKNQKKFWTRTISAVLGYASVGAFMYFVPSLTIKGLDFANTYVVKTVCKLLNLSANYKSLIIIILVLLVVALISLVWFGILSLFGAGDRKKYEESSTYATRYKPVSNVICAIIRGLLNAYVVYLIGMNLFKAVNIPMTNDLLIKFFQPIDPVGQYLKNIIEIILGA